MSSAEEESALAIPAVALTIGDEGDCSERAFVEELGLALFRSGCPTDIIEDLLLASAKGLGMSCRVFAAPTVLTIHFERHGLLAARTYTARPPSGLNTHNLQLCDALARIVEEGLVSADEACLRLDVIVDSPPLCKSTQEL